MNNSVDAYIYPNDTSLSPPVSNRLSSYSDTGLFRPPKTRSSIEHFRSALAGTMASISIAVTPDFRHETQFTWNNTRRCLTGRRVISIQEACILSLRIVTELDRAYDIANKAEADLDSIWDV